MEYILFVLYFSFFLCLCALVCLYFSGCQEMTYRHEGERRPPEALPDVAQGKDRGIPGRARRLDIPLCSRDNDAQGCVRRAWGAAPALAGSRGEDGDPEDSVLYGEHWHGARHPVSHSGVPGERS